MQLHEVEQSAITLANAAELACVVVQNIAGNEIADTIMGSPIQRAQLLQLAQAKFQNKLFPTIGG